jgi:ATP-dependent DNA ligase
MTAFFFDLMDLDGEPLFATPYQERFWRSLAPSPAVAARGSSRQIRKPRPNG